MIYLAKNLPWGEGVEGIGLTAQSFKFEVILRRASRKYVPCLIISLMEWNGVSSVQLKKAERRES